MKKALVVGCAAAVWEDVEEAKRICGEFDAIYCVKQIGIYWKESFQVWATLHPEFMDKYQKERASLGYPNGYELVGPLAKEVGMHGNHFLDRRISYRWPNMASSASSGIYAVKVALEDGYDKIVLAGVPMTAEGGHFLPHTRNGPGQVRGPVWQQHAQFVLGLGVAIPHMQGKVKSVSGYTEKVLGRPDEVWLSVTSEK